MRKFRFNKLVRDKIVSGMKKDGGKPIFRVLSNEEYIESLKNKVVEESNEFILQPDEDPLDTVVDVYEVLDNLIKALGVPKSKIKSMQKEKNRKRGSFRKRLYVDYIVVNDESPIIAYYLKNKQKYPEIKD